MKHRIIKNLRILYIIDNLNSGGKQRQLIELLKFIDNHTEITCELVVLSQDVHYKTILNYDLRIHHLIRKRKKDPGIFFKLFQICKRFKPHIIHSWGSMPSIYSIPIAKFMRIKLINGMIRDAKTPKFFSKLNFKTKSTYLFSDLIISNSKAGIQSYKVPQNKSVCIYNGFDLQRVRNLQDKKTIRKKFSINTEKVIGMVATFSDFKDYDTYFAAAKMILKKRDNVTFLAIGDGRNFLRYQKMLASESGDKIKLLGRQKDVESIINIFYAGALTTNVKYHNEGISNSILEYMALEKPVIATNSGGTSEIVSNKKHGFLINPNDPEGLYNRIQTLLDNPDLTLKMGKKGKEKVNNKFNLEKMGNTYLSLYDQILVEK